MCDCGGPPAAPARLGWDPDTGAGNCSFTPFWYSALTLLHFYSPADHLQSHVVVASLFAANDNDLQHIIPRYEVLVSLISSKPVYVNTLVRLWQLFGHQPQLIPAWLRWVVGTTDQCVTRHQVTSGAHGPRTIAAHHTPGGGQHQQQLQRRGGIRCSLTSEPKVNKISVIPRQT